MQELTYARMTSSKKEMHYERKRTYQFSSAEVLSSLLISSSANSSKIARWRSFNALAKIQTKRDQKSKTNEMVHVLSQAKVNFIQVLKVIIIRNPFPHLFQDPVSRKHTVTFSK